MANKLAFLWLKNEISKDGEYGSFLQKIATNIGQSLLSINQKKSPNLIRGSGSNLRGGGQLSIKKVKPIVETTPLQVEEKKVQRQTADKSKTTFMGTNMKEDRIQKDALSYKSATK
jgi:hypothetical protein